MSTGHSSRRDFLRGHLFGGMAKAASAVAAPLVAMNEAAEARGRAKEPAPKAVFVVARHCLAYQGSFCSVCREQCPVDGAIQVENGRPFVRLETCTACGKCQEVCPAPVNAIRIMAAPGADPGAAGMGEDLGGVAAFLPPAKPAGDAS